MLLPVGTPWLRPGAVRRLSPPLPHFSQSRPSRSRPPPPTTVLRLRPRPDQKRNVEVGAGGEGGLTQRKVDKGEPVRTWQSAVMVGVAISWVCLMVLLPFCNVFIQAFAEGVGPFVENVMDPDFLHAVSMTLSLAAICVPINTIFGVMCALELARNEFLGKNLLLSLLDLPFSISPVVVGLMLILLYGREGLLAPLLRHYGLNVVFAFPGMVLATMFVTMPFVARELIPILQEQDLAEEEAAKTLGASDWEVFWNVTLPSIRWGLLYGVILTNARAMGEFGAVAVISGNIIGQTQTLTLFVESAYKEYNTTAAFAAACLLSSLAVISLILKTWLENKATKDKNAPSRSNLADGASQKKR